MTPEAIDKAICAQVEKAQAGDAKALKFILDLASREALAPQQVHATQNVFHVHLPAGSAGAAIEDPLLLKIYAFIEAMGPHTTGQIAANLGIEADLVDEKLADHPWFEVKRRGDLQTWSIKRR